MTQIIEYHLESTLILATLYAAYQLLLRKETFFITNRFYLLFAVVVAYTIPLLHVSSNLPSTPFQAINLPEIIIRTGIEDSNHSFTIYSVLDIVYRLVAVSLFSFQLWSIGKIRKLKKISKRKVLYEKNIFLIPAEGIAMTFINQIFISDKGLDQEAQQQIITHEKVHVNHFHSIDRIIIEMLIIFQWFNPIIWMMRSAIKENHEFIADRETSRNDNENKYQNLLLWQATGIPPGALVHTFGGISLKTRFQMLIKNQSPKKNVMKYLVVIPILTIAFWMFAIENVTIAEEASAINIEKASFLSKPTPQEPVKNTDSTIYILVEERPNFPGGTEELMRYLAKQIKYPEAARNDSIQGTVFVTFVVNKNGSIHKAEILRGVRSDLDEEALNAINNMPAWEPGKQKGKPVNVQFNLPIKFALE